MEQRMCVYLLGVDSYISTMWSINTVYSVHQDCKGHIGKSLVHD